MIKFPKLPYLVPARWRNAFAIETIAMICCALKGPLKVYAGGLVGSGAVRGDGFHTIADILPITVVVTSIWLKRQKPEGYPFALREVEAVMTTLISLVILYTGGTVVWSSLRGLLIAGGLMHGAAGDGVRVMPQYLWPLVALMGGSALQSLLLGREQVAIGKETGEAALTADGKETISDAAVEVAALVGVILVQGFGLVLGEYVCGLIVAYFIIKMAFEILGQSRDVILKKSVGADIEQNITTAILETPGAMGVYDLKTFRIGRTMVACLVTVETRLHVKRHPALRYALERAIREQLAEVEDAKDFEIHLSIVAPKIEEERLAYLCYWNDLDRRYQIASGLDQATHLMIFECGANPFQGRATPYEIVGNLPQFLQQRRVKRVRFYTHGLEEGAVTGIAQTLRSFDITLEVAHFTDFETETGLKTMTAA